MAGYNIRDYNLALGSRAQAAIGTANTTSMLRIPQIGDETLGLELRTESDAQDKGKANEFAANVYPLAWIAGGSKEFYLTSELLAWWSAFALGNSVVTSPASGVYLHTATFQSGDTELPKFSAVEKLPADGSAFDQLLYDCVINDSSLTLTSGLGRSNAKLSVGIKGSGKYLSPSSVSLPAVPTLHGLNAGSATITIIGRNYTSTKRLVDLGLTTANNLDEEGGYFPGSGVDAIGAAVMGRMEHGDRTCQLTATARMDASDPEQDDIIAQTEGTGVITLTGAPIGATGHNHSCTITFQRLRIKEKQTTTTNGKVSIKMVFEPLWHASNGLVTVATKNEIALFGTET